MDRAFNSFVEDLPVQHTSLQRTLPRKLGYSIINHSKINLSRPISDKNFDDFRR